MSHALIWTSLDPINLTSELRAEIPFAGFGTVVAGTWVKKIYKLKWINSSVNDVKIWLDDQYPDVYSGSFYPKVKKTDGLKIQDDLGFKLKITVLDSYATQQLPDAIAASSGSLTTTGTNELLAPMYIDGVQLSENKNILVFGQTSPFQNGLFYVRAKNPDSSLFLIKALDNITASYTVSIGSSTFYAYSEYLSPLQTVGSGATSLLWVDKTNTIRLQNIKATSTTNLSTSGANLTLSNNIIDSVTLALNDRVLIKDQTSYPQNGIYYVSSLYNTDTNTIVNPYTSTNTLDSFWKTASNYIDSNNPVNVQVVNGTTYGGKYYRYYSSSTASTSNINWTDATHFYNSATADFYYEITNSSGIGFSFGSGNSGTLTSTPLQINTFAGVGTTLSVSNTVLVKHHIPAYSGLYTVTGTSTTTGIGNTSYWLRNTSFDAAAEIVPTLFKITNNKNSLNGFYYFLNKTTTYASSFNLNNDSINVTDQYTPYVYEPVTNLISTEATNLSSVSGTKFANSGIAVSQRVLVAGQATTAAQNGIYVVSSIGSSVNSFVYNSSYFIDRGAVVSITTGSSYFLYSPGTNTSAGSTTVKFVDITSAGITTCQAYTTKDNFSSSYKADSDFDVSVITGDKVVVNSSNLKVNGIYDVTLSSATKGKFKHESNFANWFYKIQKNIFVPSTTPSKPVNELNYAEFIYGSFQAVSTGSSTLGNVYVPQITKNTLYDQAIDQINSAGLEDFDIDWYEQDFQKYNVVAVYNAATTTNFPTSSGTAISRLIQFGATRTLISENDSVLVKIGTASTSSNAYNGIWKVRYVTSGSTGSSVYFSRHDEFKNNTAFDTTKSNVKSYASPYERPIQVINKNRYSFASGTAYSSNYIYLQGLCTVNNRNIGVNAINPDDSAYYDLGSEYFNIDSDVLLSDSRTHLSTLPRMSPYQHYIYNNQSIYIYPNVDSSITSNFKKPTFTFNDDLLIVGFPTRLYTKFSNSLYYYWEQGDRIIFEDFDLGNVNVPYDDRYLFNKNGVYVVAYIEQVNGSYKYYCKRVKYRAKPGQIDYAKRLTVGTGYSHLSANFYVALPNDRSTIYTWSNDNYDKDFMDLFVIDSSGTQYNYNPNSDYIVTSSAGFIAPLVSLASGSFYAYLYPVDVKLTLKSGYTLTSSRLYLAPYENTNAQYAWDETEYPNIKVFVNNGGVYTYYTKDVHYTLNSKEGYIQPISSFVTSGTLNVYLSTTPRYNQEPKSLMNRYYISEQVLKDRNKFDTTNSISGTGYTIENKIIQVVNQIKNSSEKNIRLGFDKKQRFNVYQSSCSFGNTVGYVVAFGATTDYLYKQRISQDGIDKKVDNKSEFLWDGSVYASTGNSLGLFIGPVVVNRNINTWVNNYSFVSNDNILVKNNFVDPISDNIILPTSQRSPYFENGVLVNTYKAGKVDQRIFTYVSGIDAVANLSYNAAFTNPFTVIRGHVNNALGSNVYALYFDPDSTNRSTSDRSWINENSRNSYSAVVQTTANLSDLSNVSSPLNGRTLLQNDVVLVKDQTNQKDNGLYTNNKAYLYSLTRSSDLDTPNELRALGQVSYGSKTYELILPDTTPYTIGSTSGNTPITWVPVKSSYTINAAVRTNTNYSAGSLATQFPDTIDSYTLADNDKVMLFSQSTASERYVGRLQKNINTTLSRVSSSPGGVGDTSYFNISNYIVKDTNRNLDYELYFNPNYTGLGVSNIQWFRSDLSLNYSSAAFASTTNYNVGTAVTIGGLFKGDKVLLRSQTGSASFGSTENLLYYIDENSTFILTRHELLNEDSEININKRVKVTGGIANTGTYALVYDESITPLINSSSLYWAKTKENIYLEDCRVASTTNISLSSPPSTIDGIVLADNDRILVKDQSTKTQNGIYVVSDSKTNVWVRASDLNESSELVPQLSVTIAEGTSNQGLIYRIKLPVPRTITTIQLTNYILDTDNIDWVEIDPNGIFNSSPETWSNLNVGNSNAVSLGNFKLNTSGISVSKRFGLAVYVPGTSSLSGLGLTASGNVRNLKLKIEYKTVED
jgi:hypothetical protein